MNPPQPTPPASAEQSATPLPEKPSDFLERIGYFIDAHKRTNCSVVALTMDEMQMLMGLARSANHHRGDESASHECIRVSYAQYRLVETERDQLKSEREFLKALLTAVSAAEQARGERDELRAMLQLSADTIRDAATAFRCFGKDIAAQAMDIAHESTSALLVQTAPKSDGKGTL